MRSNAGCLLFLSIFLIFSGQNFVQAQSGAPTLSVDAASSRHAISPEIYGIANGVDTTFAKEIKLPNVRWGGDSTTRYNWEVDSSNAGFDWYFMSGNGEATPVPGASADQFIDNYAPAAALITIPIIPYVNNSSAWNCSFPVSVYGAQQSTNPYVHPNGDSCGNSISSNGAQLTDTNISFNNVANSTTLQQGWLQHLVATHGTAANGGVRYYQLDNEPGGWSNTHRDVEPTEPPYSTIVQLGEQYAATIKQVDPGASVFGPSDFTGGGWIGTPSQQGGMLAGPYYLQQMAAYEQQHGQRILDYFDEHYYPAFTDAASQLEVTRTLWDPTYNSGSWMEQYYFNGPMELIPRFQSWVAQYYPGTKVSLSEYSIDSGKKTIVDALAEMDVLGIFGRQQLDFANMWSPPAPTDPIAYSFRMFRDYDGQGSQYGDTWINGASSDQDQLSIYSAQRSSDNAITILVLNKTTGSLSTSISLANILLPSSAQVYSYSAANLQQIVQSPDAAISNGSIAYTFPAYSATMFVIAPAPLLTTTTNLAASASTLTTGQPLTLTVTVTATGGSPGGTVSFVDNLSGNLGTGTLAGGTATFSTSSLAAGSHQVKAVYGGDGKDNGSTSNTVDVTVNTPPPPPSSPADYSLSLSSTTASENPGQSASMVLTVTPENGFNLPLALSCSGLPTGSTCVFQPPTVTPAGTPVKANLTITTTAASAREQSAGLKYGGLAYGLLIPLPFLLGLGSVRRRNRSAWWNAGMGLMLLLCFSLTAIGCGNSTPQTSTGSSGSSGPSSPPTAGTASGSYTVVVSAAGKNAPTHQIQITLTIN